jgi:hypothetical protein
MVFVELTKQRDWMSKERYTTVIILIIVSAMFFAATQNVKAADITRVYVDPPMLYAEVGSTFSIDVVLEDVANLWGWEFKLFWDNSVLECVSDVVHLPPGCNWEDPNRWTLGPGIEQDYDVTQGRYHRGLTTLPLQEPHPIPFDGTTLLVTLTFNVTAEGSCALDLQDAKLVDHDAQLISHTTEDGYFGESREIYISAIYPREGSPGTEAWIFGGGATPNSTVVTMFSDITVARAEAYKDGSWETWFTIPPVSLGEYVVYVVDNDTQASDSTIFVVKTKEITPVPITPVLITPHFRIEYVDHQAGPAGTIVYISGSGATSYGEVRVYFDETNVANATIMDGDWWSVSFEVPDVEPGDYSIKTLDVTPNREDTAFFTVTPPPTISVSPSEGPIGSKITVSGEGFGSNEGIYVTLEDLLLFSIIPTDEKGEFNATLFVPMVNSGTYTIKVVSMFYYAQALDPNVTFTVTLGVDTLLSEHSYSNSSQYEQTLEHSNFDYDRLLSDLDDLKSKYDVLADDFDDLKSKDGDLPNLLDITRNLNYIFMTTTIVFIATTAYLTTRKPKVKPEPKTT